MDILQCFSGIKYRNYRHRVTRIVLKNKYTIEPWSRYFRWGRGGGGGEEGSEEVVVGSLLLEGSRESLGRVITFEYNKICNSTATNQ